MRLGHVMQGFCATLGGAAFMLPAADAGAPCWALVLLGIFGSVGTYALGVALDRVGGSR
jgi:hypothetical protein